MRKFVLKITAKIVGWAVWGLASRNQVYKRMEVMADFKKEVGKFIKKHYSIRP